jgi:hypothetical protein
MILATHGIVGSSISGIDADWLAYYDRVIAAGGTLTTTEQNATKKLVADLKANSLWTKFKAIYPMVGASAAACAQNLKSSSFTGIFNGGVTYSSSGVAFNGSSGFMNSQLNASTNLSVTSLSFGGYTSTNTAYPGYYGAYPINYLIHSFFAFGLSEYYRPSGTPISILGGVLGMLQCNQLSTSSKMYKNNTIGASDTVSFASLPNLNMFIGATNQSGSASNFDNKIISYYYYADGFNDTEASNHYTAVQTFQTTLGRQV